MAHTVPLGIAAVVAAVGLISCAGPAGSRESERLGGEPPSPAPPPATTDPYESAASALQAMLDRPRAPGPTPTATPGPVVRRTPPAAAPPAADLAPRDDDGPSISAIPWAPGGLLLADAGPGPDAPGAAMPLPAEPAARRTALLDELTRSLEATPPDDGGGAFRRGVQLAALESIQPGTAAESIRRLEPSLSPAEMAALESLCEAMQQVGTASAATATPAGLAGMLRQAAGRVIDGAGLGIQTVALCQRVESFARYVPFAEHSFPAGRSQDLIVYVEVDGFAGRPWTGAAETGAARLAAPGDQSPQWVTEIGQELTLYTADGYQALHRPEQVVRDVTRRPRRDYFMVQRITLPPTLAIGRYTLKVTVRDKATGAEAESNVPIRVVEPPVAGLPAGAR